jgi:cation diffusion facilitator CzcD-associated flavoprotein CzcO
MTSGTNGAANAPKVVIVGAGFGGLSMAIELKRAGLDNFVVLEKAAELGGVWRENTYPGAGCDVPSPLYSFSFAPNRAWPRRYPQQADIHRYMKRTAASYDIYRHIQFDTEVTGAEFDEQHGRWTISTSQGHAIEAEVFVPAVGQLNRPGYPAFEGMDEFRGHSFHSANWDHDCDLAGKRVAVVGTGASAIQFVPEIQPKVARLELFQRSAQYIFPKFNREYRHWHHEMYRRFPVTQAAGRLVTWLFGEFATIGLAGNKLVTKLIELITLGYLRKKVRDRRLRRKLKPDYQVGCKRVLYSSDFYDTVTKPNVRLVTEPITAVTPNGVRTEDGLEREVDVIIYGTGFKATEFLEPIKIRGLGAADLGEVWADGARAYLGITVPDFPNMFLVYGPNTNLGANSIIYMHERQARYIAQAVRLIAEQPGTYLKVRPEIEKDFDQEVQRRLGQTVWTLCSNWYRAADGRVTTNWPGLVSEYSRRTRQLDPADFEIGGAPSPSRDLAA